MQRFGVLILAILSTGLTACGQDLTMPGTGTIYGDLRHPDGSPARGVIVIVEGTDRVGVSDVDGRFVINDVLAVDEDGMGRYYTVRGYAEHDRIPIGFLVDHFQVKGSQSYSVGTVTVPPTGVIRGSVRLEGTGDHSGVVVRLEGTSLQTVTRADGTYTLDRVPAHEGYVVRCSKRGYHEAVLEELPPEVGGGPIVVESLETTEIPRTALTRMP